MLAYHVRNIYDCVTDASTKFRLLRVEHLKQEDRDELITRLERDTRKMKRRFAGLVCKVVTALEEAESVTSAKIKIFLIQDDRKDLADCIDSDLSISKAMLKLAEQEPWSFFDYEILEEIVNDFCGNKPIIQEFKDYKSHFQEYCERRLDEIPLEHRSLEHMHSESLLCVKYDKNFFGKKVDVQDLLSKQSTTSDEELPTLSMIKSLQQNLSEVLGINHLILLSVEMGCVQLTFRHFKDSNPLRLLSTPQKVILALIGVKKIQCGTESHDLQLYIMRDYSPVSCKYIYICSQIKNCPSNINRYEICFCNALYILNEAYSCDG